MEHILEIKDLTVRIGAKRVLDGLDIGFSAGTITAIVGESGSGKTLAALSTLDLLPRNSSYVKGGVYFKGKDVRCMSREEKRRLRGGRIGMAFQEPFTALDPVMKCGQQVLETIISHTDFSKTRARLQVMELFSRVGLSDNVYGMYPFELSGGMRQRVMISIGLCCSPEVLILDEPTTALDVIVQARILDLIRNIQKERAFAMIFITHDFSVVNSLADMVVVMRGGTVVEHGEKEKVINSPEHPYTRGLLECIPRIGDSRGRLPEIRREKGIAEGVPDNHG